MAATRRSFLAGLGAALGLAPLSGRTWRCWPKKKECPNVCRDPDCEVCEWERRFMEKGARAFEDVERGSIWMMTNFGWREPNDTNYAHYSPLDPLR